MVRLSENETESHFLRATEDHMLQAFVITLREGLEAFLIIAISLAYLRKSQRSELIPAVHWGIAHVGRAEHRRRLAVLPGAEIRRCGKACSRWPLPCRSRR